MFSKRSTHLEFLDLGPDYYTQEEYRDCMKKLENIGKYLGGNRASLKAFKRLDFTPESILDVGCGGGAFTRLLAEKYPDAKVVGIDTSRDAIRYAQEHHHRPSLSNMFYEYREEPRLDEPSKSYDVVTATLVCHHMTDLQLTDFLKDACRVAKKAVIINDLHRHPLAYLLFAMISPVFFYNRLVLHDGLLSIRRGFKRKDWTGYFSGAGIEKKRWKIERRWAFRWVVTVRS